MAESTSDSDLLAARFTKAYREYIAMVRGRARRILMSDDAAEDLTQDVFAKLARYMHKQPKIDHVGALLFHMTTQAAVRRLAQMRKHTGVPIDAHERPARPRNVDGELLLKELLALANEEQAHIACLYFIDGMSRDEIADSLQTSRRSVGRQLDRFCDKARRLLQDREPGVVAVDSPMPSPSVRRYKDASTA
ncbi:MAG TPA: sigma-70 family RNA polymerase sigma factor [Myxococcota bacterium]|nr:sigma-70 family RNA polymerase sigma factor [Myxococcota bacterium]